MAAKSKKATPVQKRSRVKVSKIEKTGKKLDAKELKKVRGGAIGQDNAKLEKSVKGSVVNIN